jgi:hypothetical protein
LKELHKIFFNHPPAVEPKFFLTELNEEEIRKATEEQTISLHELSKEIETLENILIQILQKTLIHLETLPIIEDEEEVNKSDNKDYLNDIYNSTLNNRELVNCENFIFLLTDSQDKAELQNTIKNLRQKIVDYQSKTIEEKEAMEFTDDEDEFSDSTIESSYSKGFFYDQIEKKVEEMDGKKTFKDSVLKSTDLDMSNSVFLESSYQDVPRSVAEVKPEPREQPNESATRLYMIDNYTIWFKIGIIFTNTILGALTGATVSIFFTATLAMPIAAGVGAFLGFLLGLRLIYSLGSANDKPHARKFFSNSDAPSRAIPEALMIANTM